MKKYEWINIGGTTITMQNKKNKIKNRKKKYKQPSKGYCAARGDPNFLILYPPYARRPQTNSDKQLSLLHPLIHFSSSSKLLLLYIVI